MVRNVNIWILAAWTLLPAVVGCRKVNPSQSKGSDRKGENQLIMDQVESLTAASLSSACADPQKNENPKVTELRKEMDLYYQKKRRRYLKGAREYNNFKRNFGSHWKGEFESDPRKLYLADHRQKLRLELRKQIFKNAQDLFLSIAPNDLAGERSNLKMPKHCSVLAARDPRGWQDISRRSIQIARAKRLLNKSLPAWKKSFAELTLMAALEAQLIEKIYLKDTWKKPPLWTKKSKVEASTKFPAMYPLSQFSTKLGFPAERLRKIYELNPILARPAKAVLGYPTEKLGERLVRVAFMSDPSGDIRDWLVAFIKEGLDSSLKEAAGIEAVRTAKGITENASRQYLFGHLFYLFRHKLIDISTALARVLQRDKSIIDKTESFILSSYREWVQEVEGSLEIACEEPDAHLEELTAVTHSYFMQPAKKSKYGMFDAYCHSNWGRTLRRTLESSAEAVAGATFVLGAAFPPAAVVTLPITTTLAGASFLSRAMRKNQSMAIERSLGLLDFDAQRQKALDIGQDALTTALTMVGAKYAQRGIHHLGSWRYFVPFKNYDAATKTMTSWGFKDIALVSALFGIDRGIDAYARYERGINPLTDFKFWQNSMISGVSLLFFGKAISAPGIQAKMKGVAIGTAVSISLNHYIQNAYYLSLGKEIDYGVLQFDAQWSASIGMPKSLVLMGAYKLIDVVVGKGPAWVSAAASVALTLSQSSLFGSLYWPMRIDVVDGKRGFFEYLIANASYAIDRREEWATMDLETLKKVASDRGVALPADVTKEQLLDFGDFDPAVLQHAGAIRELIDFSLADEERGLEIMSELMQDFQKKRE